MSVCLSTYRRTMLENTYRHKLTYAEYGGFVNIFCARIRSVMTHITLVSAPVTFQIRGFLILFLRFYGTPIANLYTYDVMVRRGDIRPHAIEMVASYSFLCNSSVTGKRCHQFSSSLEAITRSSWVDLYVYKNCLLNKYFSTFNPTSTNLCLVLVMMLKLLDLTVYLCD